MVNGSVEWYTVQWNGTQFSGMVNGSVEWYTVQWNGIQWNGTQFSVMVHSSVEQYTVQHGAFGCRVDWNVNQNWERHTERC